MRKLLSILLLALFGFPAAAPLLALGQTPESRLPACCRRGGDHHCAGNMAQQMEMASGEASPNPRFAPLAPRCPYSPSTLPVQFLNQAAVTAGLVRFDVRHATQSFLSPEVLVLRRTHEDLSRPKRGPPTSIHS